MDYLKEFEWKISLYEGMLIETGGTFGRNHGKSYADDCVEVAIKYLECSKDNDKNLLLEIIDAYILQNQNNIKWKYFDLELEFLNQIRENIDNLY